MKYILIILVSSILFASACAKKKEEDPKTDTAAALPTTTPATSPASAPADAAADDDPDKDGVKGSADKCPNDGPAKPGFKIDETGCSKYVALSEDVESSPAPADPAAPKPEPAAPAATSAPAATLATASATPTSDVAVVPQIVGSDLSDIPTTGQLVLQVSIKRNGYNFTYKEYVVSRPQILSANNPIFKYAIPMTSYGYSSHVALVHRPVYGPSVIIRQGSSPVFYAGYSYAPPRVYVPLYCTYCCGPTKPCAKTKKKTEDKPPVESAAPVSAVPPISNAPLPPPPAAVADDDPDKDGVKGDNDKCPTEDVNQKDVHRNSDGCMDTDQDKIADKDDACKNEDVSKKNVSRKTGGCLEPVTAAPPLPEAKQFVVNREPTDECLALPGEREKLTFTFRAYYEATRPDGSIQEFVDATEKKYLPTAIFYSDQSLSALIDGPELLIITAQVPELISFETPNNDTSGIYDEWSIDIPGGLWMDDLSMNEIYIAIDMSAVHGSVRDSDYSEESVATQVRLGCIKKNEKPPPPPAAASAFPACLNETNGCLLSYEGTMNIDADMVSNLEAFGVTVSASIQVTQFGLRVTKDSVAIENALISYQKTSRSGTTTENIPLFTHPTEPQFFAPKNPSTPTEGWFHFPAVGIEIVDSVNGIEMKSFPIAGVQAPTSTILADDFLNIFNPTNERVKTKDVSGMACVDLPNISLQAETDFDAVTCPARTTKIRIESIEATYKESGGLFNALGVVFPYQKIAYGTIDLRYKLDLSGNKIDITTAFIKADEGENKSLVPSAPYNPNANPFLVKAINTSTSAAGDPPEFPISLSLTRKP